MFDVQRLAGLVIDLSEGSWLSNILTAVSR